METSQHQQTVASGPGESCTVPMIFSGCWNECIQHVMATFEAGFDVRLEHRSFGLSIGAGPVILGVALDEQIPFESLQRLTHRGAIAWFGWNRNDSPRLAMEAYQAGAQSVLPSSFTSAIVLATVTRLRDALERDAGPMGTGISREHQYVRGQVVIPEEHSVLEVLSGVIAPTVIHEDGAEVLLGLCGPGQMLVGHPEDSCSIRLIAHSEATVRIRSWERAMEDIELPRQLRARLQQMEAWAAMQARPHLDQRIVGLLSLLAEQFGREDGERMVIDVRITHQQLASAVGATRTTITRILRDLKRTGQLTTIGSGNSERFCLLDWEPHQH
jgi:CRP-like cAMP-binding protein